MALTKVTYSMIDGAAVNVLDYGADPTGATNSTAALQAAVDACPVNGTVYFPAGTYSGHIFIWRSDITIQGAGSASTILKLPNNCPTITVPHDGPPNPITGLPNVIEIGKCALGNVAPVYERVNVIGLTVDGNYTNNVAPTSDVFGHGIILTKTSRCFIDDVVAQNCFLTGLDNVINSNYNNISLTVKDCGNALVLGTNYPNFDVNSSKFCSFDVISEGGFFGGRMLDNCWGNTLTLSVDAPSFTGFVYDNQSVNESYSNTIFVNVVGGCTFGQGMSVGKNCRNSTITANISNVVGTGALIMAAVNTPAAGNTFNITTYGCGGAGVFAGDYCSYNVFNIVSTEDGRSGLSGSHFAVDVDGATYNQFTVSIQEGSVSQVRGMTFRAGSDHNRVLDINLDTNLVELYNDLGAFNYVHWASGAPASIASANAITLPYTGTYFSITGTTGIATIAPAVGLQGRVITLRFDASVVVNQKTVAPSNIVLAGSVNFSATAGDTLTLICDGTDWVEVARAVI